MKMRIAISRVLLVLCALGFLCASSGLVTAQSRVPAASKGGLPTMNGAMRVAPEKKGWDRSGGLQTVAWWQNTEKAELSLADTLQYLTEVDKGEVLCMRQCALRTLVGMCTILLPAAGSLIVPRLSVSTS